MFSINKNYNELLMPKQKSWYDYTPSWKLRRTAGIKTFQKICPKCGAYLPIDVEVCDNCLLKFKENE